MIQFLSASCRIYDLVFCVINIPFFSLCNFDCFCKFKFWKVMFERNSRLMLNHLFHTCFFNWKASQKYVKTDTWRDELLHGVNERISGWKIQNSGEDVYFVWEIMQLFCSECGFVFATNCYNVSGPWWWVESSVSVSWLVEVSANNVRTTEEYWRVIKECNKCTNTLYTVLVYCM